MLLFLPYNTFCYAEVPTIYTCHVFSASANKLSLGKKSKGKLAKTKNENHRSGYIVRKDQLSRSSPDINVHKKENTFIKDNKNTKAVINAVAYQEKKTTSPASKPNVEVIVVYPAANKVSGGNLRYVPKDTETDRVDHRNKDCPENRVFPENRISLENRVTCENRVTHGNGVVHEKKISQIQSDSEVSLQTGDVPKSATNMIDDKQLDENNCVFSNNLSNGKQSFNNTSCEKFAEIPEKCKHEVTDVGVSKTHISTEFCDLSEENVANSVNKFISTGSCATVSDENNSSGTSDLDDSTGEENLCITNLQRKKKLLEKTAQSRNRLQRKGVSSAVNRASQLRKDQVEDYTKTQISEVGIKTDNVMENKVVKGGVNSLDKGQQMGCSAWTPKEQENAIHACNTAHAEKPNEKGVATSHGLQRKDNEEMLQPAGSSVSKSKGNDLHKPDTRDVDDMSLKETQNTENTEVASEGYLSSSNKICQSTNETSENDIDMDTQTDMKIDKVVKTECNNKVRTSNNSKLNKSVKTKIAQIRRSKDVNSPFTSKENRKVHFTSEIDTDSENDPSFVSNGNSTVHGFPFHQRRESNAEREKRVLEMLPRDISSKVRQTLTVHRSWTDRKTKHHLSCPYCNHNLVNPPFFIRHIEKHAKKAHDCPDCGKQFTNRRNLMSHLFRIAKGTFNCDKCGFRAPNACLIRKHMTDEHQAKVEAFQCHLCAKMFRKKSYLTSHLHMVHECSEGQYECQVCGKKTSRPKCFAKHLKEHQVDPVQQMCALCGKHFKNKKSLKVHILTIHKEKGFSCQHCGKRFTSVTKVRVHERTHTGEKPFACTQCDYRTAQKSNLSQHMKTHERDEQTAINAHSLKTRKKNKVKDVEKVQDSIRKTGEVGTISNTTTESVTQVVEMPAVSHTLDVSAQPPVDGYPNEHVTQVPSSSTNTLISARHTSYMQNGNFDNMTLGEEMFNTSGVTDRNLDGTLMNKQDYHNGFMNNNSYVNIENYDQQMNALQMQQYTATFYESGQKEESSSEEEDDDEDEYEEESSDTDMEDSFDKDTDEDVPMTFQELLGRDDILPASKEPMPAGYTDSSFDLAQALQALHPEMQTSSAGAPGYGNNQFNQYTDNSAYSKQYQQTQDYDLQSSESTSLMNIHKYAQGFEELLRNSYDISACNSPETHTQLNSYQKTVEKGDTANAFSQYGGDNGKVSSNDWSMYNVSNPDGNEKEGLSSFYQAFQSTGLSYSGYNNYYDANSMAYQTNNQPSTSNISYSNGNQEIQMTNQNYLYGSDYSMYGPSNDQLPNSGTQLPATQVNNYQQGTGYNSQDNVMASGFNPSVNQTDLGGTMSAGGGIDTRLANQTYMDLQAPVSYLDQMHTET